MPKKFKNVYEDLQEAQKRLQRSIVKYKDDFYYVLKVLDHEDGTYRVYMDELGHGDVGRGRLAGFPRVISNPFDFADEHYEKTEMDKYLKRNPNSGFVRKAINSRHFGKFAPFPLGCINGDSGEVFYAERSPMRNSAQGLLSNAPVIDKVTMYDEFYESSYSVYSDQFLMMLKGEYPSYQEVVEKLRDPEVINKGAAFSREWSVLRGPIGMLMLCNKGCAVGVIGVNNDTVTLDPEKEYLKESIEELGLFKTITVE